MRFFLLVARISALLLVCLGGPAHADFVDAADYSAANRGLALLVVRDGMVVFEAYANGGRPEQAEILASGTKSFSGVIAAAAVQDGLLSLDEAVAGTITEWSNDPVLAAISIRQLLQLRSGIDGGRIGRAPTYAEAIDATAARSPGQVFSYGPVPFQIFGELMRRKLERVGTGDVETYFVGRIADPIGMSIGEWRRDRDGNPLLPHGVLLTARDWAKFGEFVRLGGAWGDLQLIDADTLAEFFAGTAANPAYGLTWWIDDFVPQQLRAGIPQLRRAAAGLAVDDPIFPDDLVMAAGLGNQRLYISQQEKLVIVRFAQIRRPLQNRFNDAEFWHALRR